MRTWWQVCKQMIAPYWSSMLVTYFTFPVVVLVFVQSVLLRDLCLLVLVC